MIRHFGLKPQPSQKPDMDTLTRRALARLPLSAEEVLGIYKRLRMVWHKKEVLDLCESHERLRLELEGAMKVIEDMETMIEKMQGVGK